MSRRPTLLVFVKYPEPGRVKTRLARTTGPERAAALYRQWISIVLGQFQALRPATRLVGYFDGACHDAFRDWHRLADDWWPQPAGDLGARLSAGVAVALDSGGPALAVGTDCLEINPDLVAQSLHGVVPQGCRFRADRGRRLLPCRHIEDSARPLPLGSLVKPVHAR